MKVKLKDLRANPYRNLESIGYKEEVIQDLVGSIKKTGFWTGVEARKLNGSVEIVSGHHRIEALKRVYGEDFEITITEKTDEPEISLKEMDNGKMFQKGVMENNARGGNNSGVTIDNDVSEAEKMFREDLGIWEEHWLMMDEDSRPLNRATLNKWSQDKVNGAENLKVAVANFRSDTAGISPDMIAAYTGYTVSEVTNSNRRRKGKELDFVDADAINTIDNQKASAKMIAALKNLSKTPVEKGTEVTMTATPDEQMEIAKMINDGEIMVNDTTDKVYKLVSEKRRKEYKEAKVANLSKKDKKEAKEKSEREEAEKKIAFDFDAYVKKAGRYASEVSAFALELRVLQEGMVSYEIRDKYEFRLMIGSIKSAVENFTAILKTLEENNNN